MDSLWPKPQTPPQWLYCVRRHGTRVEKVRVKEIAPNYVRVYTTNRLGARRESWKSLYHTYVYHYEQAKRMLEVDLETKVKHLRSKLAEAQDTLHAVNLTREEEL
jgi:hypothetical protein